jgi:hypothetical protein
MDITIAYSINLPTLTPCGNSDICIKEKSRFVRSTLLKIKANSEICIAKSVMKVIIIIGI